ncbi:protein trichome birefringence-like 19 [Telopea speciosissima]|uniref:protein trichome birefringence-like 19 n=1 Tax=Telopea speciosissima TaxID=54955 RepID=UPI001CC530E6|nr:protein trichome birefringence-like 19 [Telopea speciosissima]
MIKNCDIFKGEWVPQQEGRPLYTNKTCQEIHDHQNCFKNGRPDTDFLKWRWKPYGCELPLFNPLHFLNIVRGKSMAFVGDSVARNQMQSLMCLLSNVPVDVSYLPDGKTKQWQFTHYNFTIIFFWSPLLVKTTESIPKGPLRWPIVNLFVDEFDETWTNEIHKFDYVIVSAAQWFWRPSMFYENGKMVGCFDCKDKKVKDLTLFYGYNRAFRTALRAMYGDQNFKGITFLRTYSPGHFDNGAWNEGGTCTKTKPFMSNEKKLEGFEQKFYLAQLEEFRIAESEGKKRGLKFRLLDTTQAMLLRPDGHPGLYGHPPEENRNVSDCVHWCLPGPTDTWNEFLLHILKMDSKRSSEGNH